jgi:hypothetical protein
LSSVDHGGMRIRVKLCLYSCLPLG